MRALILALLCVVGLGVLTARAQFVGGGSISGGGGGGGGGGPATSLASGATLSSANDECSETLALAWGSDTDSGLQYLTTGTWQMCVDGVRAGVLDYAPAVTVIGRGNTSYGYLAANDLDRNGVDGATNNACFGGQACENNAKGQQNTMLGDRAGVTNVDGDQNTCVGQGACFTYNGDAFAAFGYHAGLNATGNNLFFGHRAGEGAAGSATGTANVCVGLNCLLAFTTGTQNVGVGYTALSGVVGGASNVAVGYRAGDVISSGGGNIAIGSDALGALTTQSYNIAIGNGAGDNLTDTENTIVGTIACDTCTTAAGNVIIGYSAAATGTTLTTGDGNVMIGRNVDGGAATAANRIIIGDGAQGSADNQVTIGNASITHTRTRGRDVVLAGTPSSVTTGTCTNETQNSGDDVSGEVEADCTAGQTLIVTFSAAWANAPDCVCSPSNAAAGAATALQFCDASTTALTITSVGSMTDGRVNYRCTE